MKIITFEVPERPTTLDDPRPLTRILGLLWLMYLQAHGELTYSKEELRKQYRLDDDQVYLYGQLMGEIAKSEGAQEN